ncbi:unnamed protein product [Prorocentrum cordatum]|uniref:Uncharacterized protein n=1 Tax=Prorocentrum cordatum TaxID=2364126 RepID=A0ABN9W5L9_9DINO|nr:unnamed protein product [Polarella glacialis]
MSFLTVLNSRHAKGKGRIVHPNGFITDLDVAGSDGFFSVCDSVSEPAAPSCCPAPERSTYASEGSSASPASSTSSSSAWSRLASSSAPEHLAPGSPGSLIRRIHSQLTGLRSTKKSHSAEPPPTTQSTGAEGGLCRAAPRRPRAETLPTARAASRRPSLRSEGSVGSAASGRSARSGRTCSRASAQRPSGQQGRASSRGSARCGRAEGRFAAAARPSPRARGRAGRGRGRARVHSEPHGGSAQGSPWALAEEQFGELSWDMDVPPDFLQQGPPTPTEQQSGPRTPMQVYAELARRRFHALQQRRRDEKAMRPKRNHGF